MLNKKALSVFVPLLWVIAGLVYVERFFTTIGTTIFFLSLSLAIPLSVLYFLQEKILNTWFRFTRWYIPIATILILMVPTSSGGIIPLDKERMILGTSIVFVALSLFVITLKYLRLRRRGE